MTAHLQICRACGAPSTTQRIRSSPGAAAICCRAAVAFHQSSARARPTPPAGSGAAMCAAICSSEGQGCIAAVLRKADSWTVSAAISSAEQIHTLADVRTSLQASGCGTMATAAVNANPHPLQLRLCVVHQCADKGAESDAAKTPTLLPAVQQLCSPWGQAHSRGGSIVAASIGH